MKLESELREQSIAGAEAEASHRPAYQVPREPMREFVERQRQARECDAFVGRKIEAGTASMRAGIGRSNEVVEAKFVARRASAADAP